MQLFLILILVSFIDQSLVSEFCSTFCKDYLWMAVDQDTAVMYLNKAAYASIRLAWH